MFLFPPFILKALDTLTGLWQTLPDLLVPRCLFCISIIPTIIRISQIKHILTILTSTRVQPTVVGCGGKLFVLGGRNSNKVTGLVLILMQILIARRSDFFFVADVDRPRSFFKSVGKVFPRWSSCPLRDLTRRLESGRW